MDFTNVDIYSSVTLVDRTGAGGTEFIFDGNRFTLALGEVEITVPKFVAQWLLDGDRCRVWTTEGEYVCRYGVKSARPKDLQDLTDLCGPEVAITDPITLDTTRLEGSAVAVPSDKLRAVMPVTIPRDAFRERQGAGARASFAAS